MFRDWLTPVFGCHVVVISLLAKTIIINSRHTPSFGFAKINPS